MKVYIRSLWAAATVAAVGAAVTVALTVKTVAEAIDAIQWDHPEPCRDCHVRDAWSLAGRCFDCEEADLIERLGA